MNIGVSRYKKDITSPMNKEMMKVNNNLYLTMSPKVEFKTKDRFDIK
jgi:hypothetical protein